MDSVMGAIKKTVPISQFNRGLAGKIFDEVKRTGAKVVMKNNTAEVVLVPPDEYVRTQEELEDLRLLLLTQERMAHFDSDSLISQEEVDSRYGIKPEDLEGYEEVDFE